VRPPPRAADEFTDFDDRDDLPLARLRRTDVPRVPHGDVLCGYYGPYPLFNTTLNLVTGIALAEQDRKGESFVLTPDYCGNPRTGYGRLPGLGDAVANPYVWNHLSVGRAVTVSGAAVDPNMKNFQSVPFTALLTMLNLRLGRWIEHPNPTVGRLVRSGDQWHATNPRSGVLLLTELAGLTRADGPYLHLSDGGHFENTGAYEIIRRRCRFVVAVDAAEDPDDASENLANLIRLVRIDFGIRIEIDTSALHKDADGLSRAHVAVGVIRYDDVDEKGVNGTFVFVRSSLTGDEPADVKNYSRTHPPFPHHSTLDQFFDEDQFESYRMLGFHIGRDVFARAVGEVDRQVTAPERYTTAVFAELRRQWTQVPTAQYERYTEALDPWTEWENELRSDPRLAALNRDLTPELRAWEPPPVVPDLLTRMPDDTPQAVRDWATRELAPAVERVRAEAVGTRAAEQAAVDRLVGVMENAWLRMDLSNTHALPLNRGWMNCFRQWTSSRSFQTYWPFLRPQYGWGFVRFCERVLSVPPVPVQLVRWPAVPALVRGQILDGLNREFFNDWAAVITRPDAVRLGWSRNYFQGFLNRAEKFPTAARPLVWVMTYGPPGEPEATDGPWDDGTDGRTPAFPIGVAAVRAWCDTEAGAAVPLATAAVYEFFFWVRPGFRTTEIGTSALPRVLARVTAELPSTTGSNYLMTRLPKFGGSAADSLHRALWGMFFHGFFSYRLLPAVAEHEVRMLKRIGS
jgi:hypothetical protein